jgi:glycerol-3-phosphate acyltransferase PlsY
MIEITLILVAAYLMGSVSFAILVAKVYGLPDPRSHGSGNPGATNMLRTGKKSAAALTLIGDALKGYVAVILAQWATTAYGLPVYTPYLAALAAFLGHLFPVFFGFKGGKGVATALGVLLALDPAWAAWRCSPGSSCSPSPGSPPCPPWWPPPWRRSMVTTCWATDRRRNTWPASWHVLSLLVLARHHSNIRKLLSGEEKAFKKH